MPNSPNCHIFKYKDGNFQHLTDKNGLTSNNVTDIMEDRNGNMWIGTYYGGTSVYDGKKYTNFTKDGMITGEETYSYLQDNKGDIWFAAENIGVYRYDGTGFTLYTTDDGLASNGILNIMEDSKGNMWFSSWHGLSIYDGTTFMDANQKESWTK